MKRRLWTVNRVADYLRVHPATIYKLIKQGAIPNTWVTPGAYGRPRRELIDRWCRHHTVKPPPPPPAPKPKPQLTQSGRPRRKPLPPDTIISTCRFCNQPIPFSDYTGTRARPHPWFHMSCRKLVLASYGNNYTTVNMIYGRTPPKPKTEMLAADIDGTVVDNSDGVDGERVCKRPPVGYVRAFIRAYYSGVRPLPENPTEYTRRMAREARSKAESGPVVVKSCGQTPQSDPPDRS